MTGLVELANRYVLVTAAFNGGAGGTKSPSKCVVGVTTTSGASELLPSNLVKSIVLNPLSPLEKVYGKLLLRGCISEYIFPSVIRKSTLVEIEMLYLSAGLFLRRYYLLLFYCTGLFLIP